MEVHAEFLEAGGITTRYLVAGEGRPVVLLHGSSLGIDAQVTWMCTLPVLAQRFRVYAPDMIGFGGTPPAPDGRHVQRMERCFYVRAFLQALGLERCAMVGHSEGAFVATRLAIETPGLVEALVIVTSGATAPRLGGEADADWSAAAAAVYDVAGSCTTEDDFIATIAPLSTTNPPDYLDVMRRNYRAARNSGQFERLTEASFKGDYKSYTRLQEEMLVPSLSEITARTLLIWAGADATVPVARGVALLDLLSSADMHVLGRAAHMVMIDRPRAFNRLLMDFLDGENAQ
ncbi:2-hydroxymuconate semialdehyde hydrolase [Roseovarius azorensis]|uniref:2-hydroxymuconate semialdehyde hydrolase n=1 Tax=Roseovarius azorensis TaxID=1287727 RepID=A0A1H7XXV7_9RHOB|nr:alpha/beta hydrolase [Roseovarius azorensis]SEM38786.1 2-hydroxymuconate semialdehyde hydrolase [Roseovarius azorensis]